MSRGGPGAVAPALIDENSLLLKAMDSVDQNIYLARRGFDQNQVSVAVQHMSLICQHLRTSSLAPDLYYDLWQRITESLMELESHFDDIDSQHAKKVLPYGIEHIHEVVQYCGDIIPRLYLLITVSSAYIRTKRIPAKSILFDLVELCRGVQQPMHGLFLRSYLSLMMKDKLPDVNMPPEEAAVHGTVEDSIEFILQNFCEMNKLWVRMQHQGSVRDRPKREKQRKALQQLIGANLVRLSDLQGLNYDLYANIVLPRVLEQIINCKDVLAQEFLMSCIVQVFPDDYQIGSIDQFLSATKELHEKVKVKDLVISLLKRLSRFGISLLDGTSTNVGEHGNIQSLQSIFPTINTHVNSIIATYSKMSLIDILSLQSSIVQYISTVFPDRLDYIDKILEKTTHLLTKHKDEVESNPSVPTMIIDMLKTPIQQLQLHFLELTHVGPLVLLLEHQHRKVIAISTCVALLESKNKIVIDDLGVVDALFSLLKPLIRDNVVNSGDNDGSDGYNTSAQARDQDERDLETYQNEQNYVLVCRVFHLIQTQNLDLHFKMLMTARKYIGQGSTTSLAVTLPPVIYSALQLAEKTYKYEQLRLIQQKQQEQASSGENSDDIPSLPTIEELKSQNHYKVIPPLPEQTLQVKSKRIFSIVHETLQEFVKYYPAAGLKLYVQAAVVTDRCHYEAITYEFLVQAFLAYEERVTDSKSRLACIYYILGIVPSFKNLGKENYDNIASAAYRHSYGYMIKSDQSRCLANCAHMYWSTIPNHVGHDEKKVLSSLRKALSVAKDCLGNQVHLYVEILNKYIYFYDKGCSTTEVDHIIHLAQLIFDSLEELDDSAQSTLAATHFKNTVEFLVSKKIIDENSPPVQWAQAYRKK